MQRIAPPCAAAQSPPQTRPGCSSRCGRHRSPTSSACARQRHLAQRAALSRSDSSAAVGASPIAKTLARPVADSAGRLKGRALRCPGPPQTWCALGGVGAPRCSGGYHRGRWTAEEHSRVVIACARHFWHCCMSGLPMWCVKRPREKTCAHWCAQHTGPCCRTSSSLCAV